MRETRLFDFATPPEASKFISVDVVASAQDLRGETLPSGTWAGLVGQTTAWRVEDGSSLVFENILNRTGICLNFPSPLTCRPFLREAQNENGAYVEVLLSCFASATSCTLLRCTASVASLEPTFEELSRIYMPSAYPTCLVAVESDIVVGLSDGACAKIKFSDSSTSAIRLIPFLANPSIKMERRIHGESTSMVSGVSDESNRSHRSVASSMSFGLMNRLFGSPRGGESSAPPHAIEASSQDPSHVALFSRRGREDRALHRTQRDQVLDVAKVTLDTKALASLHESGRICAYVSKNDSYQFAGEIIVPVKLSSAEVNQFLLTGPSESVIAAVMVDEDPEADSLRLYNVTAKLRPDRSVAMSCTQIAKRGGPLDKIVSVAFTGDDVVVGTETGYLSGVLNVSSETDSGVGMPEGTLWTALDDVDKPFGLGRVMDDVFLNSVEGLLVAHRFSTASVAKALRLDNCLTLTRPTLEKAVREFTFGGDTDNAWARVKARAEQITKTEELLIRDIALIRGIGIVVARNKALYLLRGMSESEVKSLRIRTHLVNDKQPISSVVPTCLLASHGACQVAAAQLAGMSVGNEDRSKVAFLLRMATAFSERRVGMPLTDVVARKEVEGAIASGMSTLDFSTAALSVASTLEPGPKLLCFLKNASELKLLIRAAEQTADKLPISSMFASGLSWLAQFRESSRVSMEADDAFTAGSENMEVDGDKPAVMLERAYGCLLTSTEWCATRDALVEDDIRAAAELAGLSASAFGTAAPRHPDESGGVLLSASENPPFGMDGIVEREHLDFWLLERTVRLLEMSGAPSSAAAAALAAMSRAPNRQRHEMMRAAAFSRFLDAGELENALRAILSDPHAGREDGNEANQEESGALRDAIGLLVNAAADQGVLQWLAEVKLPEPLHVLCGLALERRARAADAVPVQHLIRPRTAADELPRGEMSSSEESRPAVVEYEQLYSWHILRGDEASAATSALEWAERLSTEGLASVKTLATTEGLHMPPDQKVKLLLSWTKLKCQALSYASAATELERADRKFIVSSRLSLLADKSSGRSGIVSTSWVSRRHLLAHSQSRYLTIMLSRDDTDDTMARTVHYLLGQDSALLGEQKHGVGWVVSALAAYPTYDNILLCTELAIAWREEVGDGILMEIVETAARIASQQSITTFHYSDLDKLLRALVSTGGATETCRNWNLLALESALSTSVGAVASPQWLVDAAAWGTAAFAEGTTSAERSFAGRKRGDAAGVVRALLRNHRPVDAAKLLLVGLSNQGKVMKPDGRMEPYYVPYSAIDSTIEMLAQISDDYPDAESYRERLEAQTTKHIARMESLQSGSFMPVEMVAL